MAIQLQLYANLTAKATVVRISLQVNYHTTTGAYAIGACLAVGALVVCGQYQQRLGLMVA
jgi:hypothetical protein